MCDHVAAVLRYEPGTHPEWHTRYTRVPLLCGLPDGHGDDHELRLPDGVVYFDVNHSISSAPLP